MKAGKGEARLWPGFGFQPVAALSWVTAGVLIRQFLESEATWLATI